MIDAIFDSRKLTDKQKSEAIFTEEQYKSFLEEKALKASKQDIIIAQQIKDLKEKNETLKKTSENQSRSMLSIFQEQRLSFLREEVLWMIFSACIFLTIFTIAETMVAFLNP